ncbi:Hypothetical Protein FCC1311_042552 [Hondaea fermentalgiana]|uniref:Uncharacterized protein n=1 Tax=Hondaea fermentalgiana TaxID=2315210 RepID=A0A2R5GAJ6_9STRA|nr:Hypothetical Protein FCC1311_042552 [Hondaea fermentalgiana]|eukprot:GBG28032.1 Hypothetical Protein FCC1311_042552 [Hondaea fermentalgiana]
MSCYYYGVYPASSSCCNVCPSTAETCYLPVGDVVCIDGDGNRVYTELDSTLSTIYIAIIAVVVVVWILTLVGLYCAIQKLQKKEAFLPPDQRSLTCGMIVLMVLMTLCLGWIGLLLMYLIINSQIDSAINRNAMQQVVLQNKV